MINWTKKRYAKELGKRYWELEPHFFYYCQFEVFYLFRTFVKNKMNIEEIYSALYGKFVSEGKPIGKGFYNNMNLMSKIVKEITEKCRKDKQGVTK